MYLFLVILLETFTTTTAAAAETTTPTITTTTTTINFINQEKLRTSHGEFRIINVLKLGDYNRAKKI